MDKRISQLPNIDNIDYTGNDVFALVGYGPTPTGVTYKTKLSELQSYITSGLTDYYLTGLTFDNGTNVGIGTTSPNDRLTIQSGTSVASAITFRANNVTSTSELFLGQAAGNEAYVYNRANQPMIFGTNNTERLRITSGGVVGINTQSPVELLSLAGSVGTTFGYSMNPSGWNGAKHRYTVPSAGDESIISYNYNGSAVDFASYATSSIGVGNGVLRFSTGGTNAAPSERMRIFANGRVGVNTTTDAGYQFDINGTLRSVNGANFATNGTSHIGMGTVPSAWSWPNGVTQFRFGGHIAVADNSFLQLGTNSFYDGSNYVRVNAGYSSRYLPNDELEPFVLPPELDVAF